MENEQKNSYIKSCIALLEPKGDVLEIGFGGYSSKTIQSYSPKSHTIVESRSAIAKKARIWAKNYANVHIIETNYSSDLTDIGPFDEIFCDDYFMERKPKEEKEHFLSSFAKRKEEMSALKAQFSFLENRKYSNEDIEEFISLLTKRDIVEEKYLLAFLEKLKDRENITEEQWQKSVEKLIQSDFLSQESVDIFAKEQSSFSTLQKSEDNVLSFLEQCLEAHMHTGSKFSCFLEDSLSKYEDPLFFKRVITNPSFAYKEKKILAKEKEGEKNKEALILVITLLSPNATSDSDHFLEF